MLALKEASKLYKLSRGNNIFAFERIDLEFRQGEFACIVGPSGCGKSAIVNVLGCMELPSSGEYYVDGIEISKYTPNQLANFRNQKIGFIFQNCNLLFQLTALENVELPLIYQGLSNTDRHNRALDALKLVNMDNFANIKASKLSCGQQQLVAIARALVSNPKIILADEPTANLDSQSAENIIKILTKINSTGTTVIVITNNTLIVDKSRRVIKIISGKVVEDIVRTKFRKNKSAEVYARIKPLEKPVKTRKRKTKNGGDL